MQFAAQLTVDTVRVASACQLRDTPGVTHRPETFVGRRAELAVVTAALDDALTGRGGTVVLRGEPGIGKSRLAEESASLAAARGYTVVWGRCWEAGGAPAFWPWMQALRTLCRDLSDTRLTPSIRKRLAALLPELDPAGGEARTARKRLGGADVTSTARFQRLDAFSSALCELATDAPILIVLDDLHAADQSTLALLDFTARQLHSANVVVLGTLRDREAQRSPHAPLLGRIAQDARSIPLGPLEPAAVRSYLSESMPASEADALAEALHKRTDGHPLFIVELLRLLAANRGAMTQMVWQLNLPQGLEQTLRMRTAELAEGEREVIAMAAIMGRQFSAKRLLSAFALEPEPVHAAVEAAARLGIVLPVSGEQWRFSHILVRDVLEHDLGESVRWSLHRRVAEALVQEDTALCSEVAHHFERAGPDCRPQAIDALRRAGDAAVERLAFEDAARDFQRALELHGDDATADIRVRVELLLGLCRAAMRGGQPDDGWRYGKQAAAIARARDDESLLARAALELGSVLVFASVDDELVSLLREALAAQPPGDSPLRALVQARLAAALQPAPEPEHPIAMAKAAIEMARRVGDTSTLLATLRNGCSALVDLAPPEERLVLNREHASLATEAGELQDAFRAETRLIFDCFELGDRLAADRHVRATASIIEQIDHNSMRWQLSAQEAMRAAWDGALEPALEACDRAAALGARVNDPNAKTATRYQRQRILRMLGRRDEMIAGIAELRQLYLGTPVMSDYRQVTVASQLLQVGDQDAALGIVDRPMLERLLRLGDRSVLEQVAELALASRDVALAQTLRDRAEPWADQFQTGGVVGMTWEAPVHRMLALCAQTVGDTERAVHHFERGIAGTRRMGGEPVAAWMSAELGALLITQGRHDRAREILTAARREAASMSMASVVRRTELSLRGLSDEASPVPPKKPPPSESPADPALGGTAQSDARVSLSREGDVWLVRFDGAALRTKDSKGMQFLAVLVENAGNEVHALDLAAPKTQRATDAVAHDVLDDTARNAYRDRVTALRAELDEAESWNDSGRSERLRDELEALTAELSRAVGLGGRPRRFGTDAERARVNVQRRLRDAIRRLAEHDQALGRHLERAIRTGMHCAYDPE